MGHRFDFSWVKSKITEHWIFSILQKTNYFVKKVEKSSVANVEKSRYDILKIMNSSKKINDVKKAYIETIA